MIRWNSARLFSRYSLLLGMLGLFLFFEPLSQAESNIPGKDEKRVVLLGPRVVDARIGEALARVSGELFAAGFEAVQAVYDGNLDPRAEVEDAVRTLNSLAALALVYRAEASSAHIELWVSECINGRTTVQRLVIDPDAGERGVTVLAVRAVDLLKAALAEHWSNPAPVANPVPPAQPVPRRKWQPAVGAGLSWLLARGSLSSAWEPSVHLSLLRLPGDFFVRLTFAGLGSESEVQGRTGTARLSQSLAAVGSGMTFGEARLLSPFWLASAGTHRLHVVGNGSFYPGKTETAWSLLTALGGGARLRLGSHWSLLGSVVAFATWPQTIVRIDEVEVARAGRFSLAFDACVEGRF
jgi:hypothetical protein